ncbi:hypothetical protein YC2023_020003 [Brassica napus]
MSSEVYYRLWMDKPHLDPNTNLLTEEYVQRIGEFMRLVQQQPDAKSGMLRCPCFTCNNNKVIKEFDVWTHLYMKGFSRNYKVWYLHGETGYEYGSTSEPQPVSELQPDIRYNNPSSSFFVISASLKHPLSGDFSFPPAIPALLHLPSPAKPLLILISLPQTPNHVRVIPNLVLYQLFRVLEVRSRILVSTNKLCIIKRFLKKFKNI